MKNGRTYLIIFMLVLSSTVVTLSAASYQQVPESQKELINKNIHHGFVIGVFATVTWEEERCILTTDNGPYPYNLPVTFIIPFRLQWCAPFKQVQLLEPKFCIFRNNFVIGFSKILFPESTISMHIINQSDDFNTIRWVVDNIEGDKVWGGNLHADLYLQNGSRYTGGVSTGPFPWKATYLNIGDEFFVKARIDGMYQMKLIDSVSGYVLFVSPFLHF